MITRRVENPVPLKSLLVAPPDDLLVTRAVSPKLNSPKFDSPELLEETA
jgi:hypothetical protein